MSQSSCPSDGRPKPCVKVLKKENVVAENCAVHTSRSERNVLEAIRDFHPTNVTLQFAFQTDTESST